MADMSAQERAQEIYSRAGECFTEASSQQCQACIAEIVFSIRAAERAAYERAAVMAHSHGEFCDREARNGGHTSLFERAKGAAHIAAAIRRLADDA